MYWSALPWRQAETKVIDPTSGDICCRIGVLGMCQILICVKNCDQLIRKYNTEYKKYNNKNGQFFLWSGDYRLSGGFSETRSGFSEKERLSFSLCVLFKMMI